MLNLDALPRAQTNTHTSAGRSDLHFAALAGALHGQPPERILSFGCSQGYECLSLGQAFPGAEISGCDVNEQVLETARTVCAGKARIFHADEAQLAAHGTFDLITAFSVLCRYPLTKGQVNISAAFPFSLFQELVATLDRHLSPGGVLMLYNAQYFFQDTDVAARYIPVLTPEMPDVGFLHRHDPMGERMTTITYICDDGTELDEAAGMARQELAQKNGVNLKLLGLDNARLEPLDDRLTHDLHALAWRKMA
ncbi:class I SAM-dependent methyltransferase [Oceanibium sediminis]|uniref:class I SAM-dependent methyltransferase n=1 Tax=Oceanibium sediminis TaxID=2026339 RepID=UPI001300ABFE|nr:class I SAM-dependent methyltransferase [Oceanibium sediminis]